MHFVELIRTTLVQNKKRKAFNRPQPINAPDLCDLSMDLLWKTHASQPTLACLLLKV
jgi:hypothetical protein